MKHHWDKYLSDGEIVKKEFGVSSAYSIIVLGIITGLSIFLGFTNLGLGFGTFVLGVIYFYYLAKGKKYALTNKSIILVDSFLGKDVVTIKYQNITDIKVEQNAIDLIGNWGSIIINTAGSDFSEGVIQYINDPNSIKNMINNITSER